MCTPCPDFFFNVLLLDSVFTGVMYVWTYTTEGEEVALDKG